MAGKEAREALFAQSSGIWAELIAARFAAELASEILALKDHLELVDE